MASIRQPGRTLLYFLDRIYAAELGGIGRDCGCSILARLQVRRLSWRQRVVVVVGRYWLGSPRLALVRFGLRNYPYLCPGLSRSIDGTGRHRAGRWLVYDQTNGGPRTGRMGGLFGGEAGAFHRSGDCPLDCPLHYWSL